MTMPDDIRWISDYFDREIPKTARDGLSGQMDGMTLDLVRLIKMDEEVGEVVSNFIGFRALNPRKGQTVFQESDIVDELLDVAITALGTAEHFIGNSGLSIELLERKIKMVRERLDG